MHNALGSLRESRVFKRQPIPTSTRDWHVPPKIVAPYAESF
jgi:hypothetical protein